MMKILFKTVDTFFITASTASSMILIATGIGVLNAILLAVSVVRSTTMGILVMRAQKVSEKSSQKKNISRGNNNQLTLLINFTGNAHRMVTLIEKISNQYMNSLLTTFH